MAKIDTKPAATSEEKSPLTVTFRDLAFKSRTLMLADGRSFAVEQGRIQTGDAALIAFLEKHPDFQREAEPLAGA
ncbi:hypothetical protein [Enterobacter roggenkampii]|uniref:hypothetical protein n=1 Tax=Enterobacter roggenkampii TaxID=1812935 RepID=UPI0015E96762|nr:hypothetical protein [Enterobacter roggenkampii]QLS00486.1 hypothetical protein HV328_05225 [Enterobacter roggenkampii]